MGWWESGASCFKSTIVHKVHCHFALANMGYRELFLLLFLAHLHVIFFSSDLRKSSYVLWHMPFIITQKMSLSPLYLIQHDGEVPRLATTGAQLRAACLCLPIMCLNYQTLLRAKRCLGRATQPMVPLHSTTLTQAGVQALPELAYRSLEIPLDSVHILVGTHTFMSKP